LAQCTSPYVDICIQSHKVTLNGYEAVDGREAKIRIKAKD